MRYSFLLLLVSCLVFSQTIKFSGTLPIGMSDYAEKVLDESRQNVYYKTTFIKNPKNPKATETITLLRIGEKFSRFSDANAVKYDSLMQVYVKEGKVDAKGMTSLMALKAKWQGVLVKNLKDNKVITQKKIKENFQYEEPQPTISWKIGSETKNIIGYACRKAVGEYRGRKYTAWYAVDLPINNGPYIFQNLPGLVMELEDADGHYHFEAMAINQVPEKIYMED
ncbi:MAG: GLPGLI family protein, partial [Bergeyella zoohelcum]|nr:GLPGLI family protein [Bergeyella zoohelcum]